MKKLIKTIQIATITTVLAMAGINVTYATTGDFTVYPLYTHNNNKSWIIQNIQQGKSYKDSIIVENLTDKETKIDLTLKEAKEENGKFLLTETEQYKNIGNWTHLQESTITLTPHEKRKIDLEVNIPKNANIKTYTATVLASKSELNKQNIKITTRIGVRMYLTVKPITTTQTNIFNTTIYKNTFFFTLSLIGLIAAILYNIIQHIEYNKHEKQNA